MRNDEPNDYDQETGEVHRGTVRESFGGRELAHQSETAAIAVAKRVEAMVQARFVIALKHPRVLDDVRVKLLKDCERPTFAEVARFKREVGSKKNDSGQWEKQYAEGPSIRFVEAAIRLMGNLDASAVTLFDDDSKRILRCEVIDYETGASWAKEITIAKTVERRELKKGQAALGRRLNSYGDTVYIVPANDDQFATKEGAMISKTLRTLGQRLIPGDLIDECMNRVLTTQRLEVKRDPGAAKKRLVDGFAAIGVSAADLIEYLGGQSLDGLTEDQYLELRAIGTTLKDGDATWRELLETSRYRATSEPAEGASASNARTTALREKIEGRKAGAKAAKIAAPTQPAEPPAQPPGREMGED